MTMEGREEKHIILKKLSENSSSKNHGLTSFSMSLLCSSGYQKTGLPLVTTKPVKMSTFQGGIIAIFSVACKRPKLR